MAGWSTVIQKTVTTGTSSILAYQLGQWQPMTKNSVGTRYLECIKSQGEYKISIRIIISIISLWPRKQRYKQPKKPPLGVRIVFKSSSVKSAVFQEHKPSRVLAYAFPGTTSLYRARAYTAITAEEEKGRWSNHSHCPLWSFPAHYLAQGKAWYAFIKK